MPASPVEILVLRHGQSEWNAVRRWQGTADPPLTQLGREQAFATGRRLAAMGSPFVGVWASDLRRASATAEIIAVELELGVPVLDTRLREAHAGEWEGLTVDEIETGWPGWLQAHHRPPAFEPYPAVVARATAALSEIAGIVADRTTSTASRVSGGGRSALVVTHTGLVRSIVRDLGRVDDRVPNLGGVWLKTSLVDGRSELTLGDLFDPDGVVVSGIDAPGEDPGE